MSAPIASVGRGADGRAEPDGEPPDRDRLRTSIVGHENVPSIPTVLTKILALEDSDADVRDLLAIVESDPALTARILRTANSPFFGQARGVSTVSRATVVLGTAMVRNLTVGLVVWDSVETRISAGAVAPLWEHCLTVARAAHELASRSGTCDPSEAFTAGLLHDAGLLVLARRFAEAYLPLLSRGAAAQPIEELERTAFGVDHAEVGGWLFEAWRMPQPIVEAVSRHHDPILTPGLSAAVAAANALVRHADPRAAVSDAAREDALARAADAGLAPEVVFAVAESL